MLLNTGTAATVSSITARDPWTVAQFSARASDSSSRSSEELSLSFGLYDHPRDFPSCPSAHPPAFV